MVPIFVDTSFYDATSITLSSVWVKAWILRSFQNNPVKWGRKHLKIYSSALFWFFPQHENFNVKIYVYSFYLTALY